MNTCTGIGMNFNEWMDGIIVQRLCISFPLSLSPSEVGGRVVCLQALWHDEVSLLLLWITIHYTHHHHHCSGMQTASDQYQYARLLWAALNHAMHGWAKLSLACWDALGWFSIGVGLTKLDWVEVYFAKLKQLDWSEVANKLRCAEVIPARH